MTFSAFDGGFQQALALPPDWMSANPDVIAVGTAGALQTAVLTPTFYPINLPGVAQFLLDSIQAKVTVLEAAAVIGAAIYSYTIPADNQITATLEGQLNVALDGASAATAVKAKVTTGAAGSGAAPLLLDFTRKRYLIGGMVNTITTMQISSVAEGNTFVDMNLLKWISAARANVSDWPASFTQANVANTGSSRFAWFALLSAQGALQI